jgi:predicted butyrate kinase (DUF1464 family)
MRRAEEEEEEEFVMATKRQKSNKSAQLHLVQSAALITLQKECKRKKWNYFFYFVPTVRYIRERKPNLSNYPVWHEKGSPIQ